MKAAFANFHDRSVPGPNNAVGDSQPQLQLMDGSLDSTGKAEPAAEDPTVPSSITEDDRKHIAAADEDMKQMIDMGKRTNQGAPPGSSVYCFRARNNGAPASRFRCFFISF